MKSIFCILIYCLLTGCAYSIQDVPIDNIEPECIRDCSKFYSSCVSQGNQVGLKTETLRACKESYLICTSTCPSIN